MRATMGWGAAGFAAGLAAFFGTAATISSCGGAGGFGLGIATLGISTILSGASPGMSLRDPAFRTGSQANPVTVSSAPVGAEPAIVLNAADTIDRVIVVGGPLDRIVRVDLALSGTPGDQVRLTALGHSWEDATTVHSFGTLATGTATVASAVTAVATVNLDLFSNLSQVQIDQGENLAIGDQLYIRIQAANTNSGAVMIDAAQSRVSTTITLARQCRLTVRPLTLTTFQIDLAHAQRTVTTPSAPNMASVPAGQSFLGCETFNTGPIFAMVGMPVATSAPDAIEVRFSAAGWAYSFLASGAGGDASFRLQFEDGAGNVIARGATHTAVNGSRARFTDQAPVVGAEPVFTLADTGGGTAAVGQICLRVVNLGPGNLQFFGNDDPGTSDSSEILIPGPRVYFTFADGGRTPVSGSSGGTTADDAGKTLASQPDPAQ